MTRIQMAIGRDWEAGARPDRGARLSRAVRGNGDTNGHGVTGKVDSIPQSKAWSARNLTIVSPEWIHLDLAVLNGITKNIGDAGGPALAFDLRMVRRVRVDFQELDARRIRRLPQLIKDDVLDLNIDVWDGACPARRSQWSCSCDSPRQPPAARQHSGSRASS